ncbi:MAG: 50S ribosomal protein L10 [Candidatus Altiarchaeum hamiconexum]|uniref:50S ribosomal protein L10 n=1 Tax=Candidatus Altarchaeum hamiconexum TaxID=1803513 RepID=A0A8J7YYR6_9ARCH|nr:50S ribosomal protein L10 [Candidatus Altarchaeum hamiconexum]OIQ05469.1 MAG: 50S ribosomal protein L10 [Candidatus Altarchaeum sp. CG2_30_32_3053]PIN67949.1 MAG: 50S ribosomal protein L10 [Candidatus Altarchaeum sp. CG12_big_fil_rev_8_21_14_0_65_33_22]PIV27165.1 MAG: 50S ribosomal protein L10 [Candidatus Altarchaeum sp. CG03_land_8_20_14_0_80_32_618]PIX49361.1 MAG: 50S ribosomal protein L10 [Candidatus Altarchaeum sp. CG_4_8_14_3_um_filter_33_2054]PIZ31923.1 MAG: 50S ribosomal protein L10 
MVTQAKIKAVEKLTEKIKNSRTIMVGDFLGLPSANFHNIRVTTKDLGEIYVVKNTLAKKAFENADIPQNSSLANYLIGNIALIFSNENPFKVYKKIAEQKTYAPPKPNSVANEDIVIKAGPTPFSPGPMAAEMQKYGIKAAIKKGKIEIGEDSVAVKKGARVPAAVSQILGKLGITPVELWLRIKAGYERGTMFSPEILNIDIDSYKNKIISAHQTAMDLAIAEGICNKFTVNGLIAKAFFNTKNLAIERGIPAKETVNSLIAKAGRCASALKSNVKG